MISLDESDTLLLERFIPTYPDISDPQFISKIHSKKEFYDLTLQPSEELKDGSLQHQQFFQRFFSVNTPYREALVCHAPGTGKTCLVAAIQEHNKHSPNVEPALVLVRNEQLILNFTREIRDKCTKNVYIPFLTDAEMRKGVELTDAVKKKRIRQAIKKSYEILTIGTFIRNMDLLGEDVIRRRYSNRLIIIDESHHLRTQSTDDKDMYSKIHKFLHIVKECRILLLSGTPIWDHASEIATQMNLILPLDKQLPIGKKFEKRYFDKEGNVQNQDELVQIFKGRVSYLRAMMTIAKRTSVGTTLPWMKHLIVYPDGMSEYQSAVARHARSDIEKHKDKGDVEGGTIYRLAIGASNFAFPILDDDGKVVGSDYTDKEFNDKVRTKIRSKKLVLGPKDELGRRERRFVEREEYKYRFPPALRAVLSKNLSTYSVKFASVIQNILDNPNELIFVFTDRVTGSGGAICFGLCLELAGLTWIRSSKSMDTIGPNRRFAILTSEEGTTSSSKDRDAIIDMVSRPNNSRGDYLQVIVGSKAISEGITLRNFRQVHILTPEWNLASLEQVIYRVFRFGSHDDLPEEDRTVKIYRHIAVERAEEGDIPVAHGVGYPSDASFTDYETIDVFIYRKAEEKDFKNAQIYRLLKMTSFDCPENYKRNVLSTDEPGSRDCDYNNECNYKCIGTDPDTTKDIYDYSLQPNQIDTSTYSMYYNTKEVEDITRGIIKLFGNYFSLELGTLRKLLNDPPYTELMTSLDKVINERTIIRNRYGFGVYLKEYNNIFFLDDSIKPNAKNYNGIYVEHPLVTERTSMKDLVTMYELSIDRNKLVDLCKDPSPDKVQQLTHRSKILVLETVYKLSKSKKLSHLQAKLVDVVMKELGKYLYTVSDGTVVHLLHTEEFKGTSYDVAAKDIKVTGMMKMFNGNEWVYAKNKEKDYVDDIHKIVKGKKIEKVTEGKIRGWISKKDNNFRIIVPKVKGVTRGKVCGKGFKIHELVDILVEVDGLPDIKESFEDLSIDDVIEVLTNKNVDLERFSDVSEEYLKKLLTAYSMSSKELCRHIQDVFEKEGYMVEMD